MIRANGTGDKTYSASADIAVYDELPPATREALRNAPFGLASDSARRLLRRYDDKEAASVINEFIIDCMLSPGHHESTVRWWTWPGGKWLVASDGKDHPQAVRDPKWNNYVLTRKSRATRLTEIKVKHGIR